MVTSQEVTGYYEPRSAICRTLEARLPRTQKVKCRTSGDGTVPA